MLCVNDNPCWKVAALITFGFGGGIDQLNFERILTSLNSLCKALRMQVDLVHNVPDRLVFDSISPETGNL